MITAAAVAAAMMAAQAAYADYTRAAPLDASLDPDCPTCPTPTPPPCPDCPTPPPPPLNTAPTIIASYPKETKDTTPTIRATVRDRQTDLAKGNIKVFVDGKGAGFSYNRETNRLTVTTKKLAVGKRHTVKITARDAQGKTATKTLSFKVVAK